jgi:hypothetical protein
VAATAPKSRKKPQDIKSLIASGKLPERSVEICLRADLFAAMQDIERDLQRAERTDKAAGSLASGTATRDLAARMEAVRADMLEHSLTFVFRALPRRAMAALQVEFPIREDNAGDAAAGLNIDDATEALVHRCLVSPELDAEDWENLDNTLSDGQYQLMANAVWAICSRDVEVPFSRLASRIVQSSGDE